MTATRVLVATAIVLLTMQGIDAAEAPPGASSCTGCHAGATGIAEMHTLAGMPAAAITDKMIAFKSGSTPATIMDRIAKGFTEEEIRAIASWYAAQKP